MTAWRCRARQMHHGAAHAKRAEQFIAWAAPVESDDKLGDKPVDVVADKPVAIAYGPTEAEALRRVRAKIPQ